jgi:hypothetical protein
MAACGKAGRGLAVLISVALPIAGACSGSPSPPAGSGDDVSNYTNDAEVRATPNPTPADAGPDAYMPSAYEDAGASSYPGFSECGGCTCPADKAYCFGGATPRQARAPFAGSGDAGRDAGGDAGVPQCPFVDADAGPQLGCNLYPSGCTDCQCTINLIQPQYSCYLVCASNGAGQPATAYCPSP